MKHMIYFGDGSVTLSYILKVMCPLLMGLLSPAQINDPVRDNHHHHGTSSSLTWTLLSNVMILSEDNILDRCVQD